MLASPLKSSGTSRSDFHPHRVLSDLTARNSEIAGSDSTLSYADSVGRANPYSFPPALPKPLQRKATLSIPGDPSEREADQVSDQVLQSAETGPMRTTPPAIQRKCSSCQEEERQAIHMKSETGSQSGASLQTETALRVVEGHGSPLSPEVRDFFEPRFGYDFSKVRIHADGQAARSAQSLQARAYTTGQDIVFGVGEFRPESREGKRLLGHELTHVVQQAPISGSRPVIQRQEKSDAVPSKPDSGKDSTLPAEKGQLTLGAFGFGHAELTPGHIGQLQKWVEQFNAAPLNAGDMVLLVGHTDQVGSLESNQSLGLQRAESAKAWMQKNWAQPPKITTDSLGETVPAVKTINPEQTPNPANRRVEIFIQRAATANPAPAAIGQNNPSPVTTGIPVPNTKIPGPNFRPTSPDPRKRIVDLTEMIPGLGDAVKRDPLVRELRDLLVKIQPVMPDGEAKKKIDEAIGKLVNDGVKSGIMALLQAATGKSPTPVPPDPSHIGPALNEVPKPPIVNIPLPLPYDNPSPVHHNLFDFSNVKKNAKPGGTIAFKVHTPDSFVPHAHGSTRVVIMGYEDFTKNGGQNAERLGSAEIISKGKVEISIKVPDKPGKYVLGIMDGMSFESSATSEFTVAP